MIICTSPVLCLSRLYFRCICDISSLTTSVYWTFMGCGSGSGLQTGDNKNRLMYFSALEDFAIYWTMFLKQTTITTKRFVADHAPWTPQAIVVASQRREKLMRDRWSEKMLGIRQSWSDFLRDVKALFIGSWIWDTSENLIKGKPTIPSLVRCNCLIIYEVRLRINSQLFSGVLLSGVLPLTLTCLTSHWGKAR